MIAPSVPALQFFAGQACQAQPFTGIDAVDHDGVFAKTIDRLQVGSGCIGQASVPLLHLSADHVTGLPGDERFQGTSGHIAQISNVAHRQTSRVMGRYGGGVPVISDGHCTPALRPCTGGST
ncbi:hypothetical protein D3C84_1068000 [compost metagenome]